jgi:maltose alpha-D-glucosyltransferase/alpha-amylase
MLTLPPYGFYWFLLAAAETLPEWHAPHQEILPEFITLTCRGTTSDAVLTGENRERLAREVLPSFLQLQRWYGAKGERVRGARILPGPVLGGDFSLSIVEVETAESGVQLYSLPLHALWGEEHVRFGAPTLGQTLAKVRRTNRPGALVDAARDSDFAEAIVAAMRAGTTRSAGGLTFRAEGTPGIQDLDAVDVARALGVEQSNVSIAFGDKGLLKIYRRLRPGRQPDIEVGRFLTEVAQYPNTPAFLGEATVAREGEEPATVAACFAFVPNQGDGWKSMVDALGRELEDRALAGSATAAAGPVDEATHVPVAEDEAGPPEEEKGFPYPLDLTRILGQRTGELHRAFATPTDDPAFAVEPVTADDIAEWAADTRAQAEDAFRRMHAARPDTGGDTGGGTGSGTGGDAVRALLGRRDEALGLIDRLGRLEPRGAKSRIHGDYHLGQVLVSQGDFYIIDFEGEPRRSMDERRAKGSPLRDVAGMLRSFDYAAFAAIDRLRALGRQTPEAEELAWAWRDRAVRRFREGYAAATEGLETIPANAGEVLRLLMLQKAFYEIGYEAANRPAWLSIPVRGVLALLDQES